MCPFQFKFSEFYVKIVQCLQQEELTFNFWEATKGIFKAILFWDCLGFPWPQFGRRFLLPGTGCLLNSLWLLGGSITTQSAITSLNLLLYLCLSSIFLSTYIILCKYRIIPCVLFKFPLILFIPHPSSSAVFFSCIVDWYFLTRLIKKNTGYYTISIRHSILLKAITKKLLLLLFPLNWGGGWYKEVSCTCWVWLNG